MFYVIPNQSYDIHFVIGVIQRESVNNSEEEPVAKLVTGYSYSMIHDRTVFSNSFIYTDNLHLMNRQFSIIYYFF